MIDNLPEYIKLLNSYNQLHYPANKKITAEEWNALWLATMHQGNHQEDMLAYILNDILPVNITNINDLISKYSENYNIATEALSNSETALSNSEEALGNSEEALQYIDLKVDKVEGKDLSTNDLTDILKSNYDTAYTNTHTHSNKLLLDAYTQSETDLASAVSLKHSHSNKTILDNITASYTTDEQAKLLGIANGAQVNIIEEIKVNNSALTPTLKSVNITIPVQASDVNAMPDTVKYGATINLSYTANTGVLGIVLKDQDGTQISSDTVDLPLELLIESGSVKTCTIIDTPIIGYIVGDKYIDLVLANSNHIYIKVSDLIDQITITETGTGNAVTDISISGNTITETKGKTFVETNRTVNGHALSSDITITKSDVGLGNAYNPTAYGGISYGGGAGESGISFTDLNILVYTGFYTCFGTTAHVPSSSYSWFIEHINSNVGTTSAIQIATAYATTTIIYIRHKISSTWGAWENISPSLKVDKVAGKGLSTEDYTTTEKNKLSGIASGAQVNVIETVKINGTALTPTAKAVDVTVPTKTSDLTNDSGFITDTSNIAKLDTAQTFTKVNTFNAPTNIAGTEQATTKFMTANGGSLTIGKEGENSGTMLKFCQVDGTPRLLFRSSVSSGSMVWSQPEGGAKLFIDLGMRGSDYHRISMPETAGTLALISDLSSKVDKTTTGSVRRVYGVTASNTQELTEIKTTAIENSTDLITSGGVYTILGNIETLLAEV